MIDYCKNIPYDTIEPDYILKCTNINFRMGSWIGCPNEFYRKRDIISHICKHIIDINIRECYCSYKQQTCIHNYYNNICTKCEHDNIACIISIKNSFNIMEKVIASVDNIKKDEAIDLINIVLDNGFYPSHDNLKKLNTDSHTTSYIKYSKNYRPLIDYIIKCDINNITNNKPKNITKNTTTLKTLLLIRKYCSLNLPFCVIKHNIIPYIYKI